MTAGAGDDRLDPFVSTLAARARERATSHCPVDVSLSADELTAARDRMLAALDASPKTAPRRVVRRDARWTLGIGSLAAAAILVLRVHFAPAASSVEDLSGYSVSVAGHIETDRAATSAPSKTLQAKGSAIEEVILRPREPVASPLDATVVVVRDGRALPSGIVADVTARGVVRFTVGGDALIGASEVRVILSRAHTVSPRSALPRVHEGGNEGPMATVTIPVEN